MLFYNLDNQPHLQPITRLLQDKEAEMSTAVEPGENVFAPTIASRDPPPAEQQSRNEDDNEDLTSIRR